MPAVIQLQAYICDGINVMKFRTDASAEKRAFNKERQGRQIQIISKQRDQKQAMDQVISKQA